MKVIHELIEYLYKEARILTENDINSLVLMGYSQKKQFPEIYGNSYYKEYGEDYGYHVEEMEDYCPDWEDEGYKVFVDDFQKSLEDTRRRKQGKIGKFYVGKTKKSGTEQDKRRLRYYFVTNDNIVKLKGKIPTYILSLLANLKGQYFLSKAAFKAAFTHDLSETKQAQVKPYLDFLFKQIEHSYKIKNYIEKDNAIYITPKGLNTMRKKAFIYCSGELETYLLLSGGRKIQLTNRFGKILQPIILKK